MSEADCPPQSTVPYRVTEPTRIPVERYYDPQFFALEDQKLWPRAWQMACRLEEIPDAGDWVTYEILGRSVIVIRGRDGAVRAYHNACRHRGVRLAQGQGNCADHGFTCPFHGWRWNMDGENTFVFGRHVFREEDLDPADLALPVVRVETWGGCAFINFDDGAAPLRESLGAAAERMDTRLVGELKVEWWRSAVLPVNWKTAMEAFMEGYHVMATHPQLHAVTLPEHRAYGPDAPGRVAPVASESARAYLAMTIEHIARLHEGMAGMITPWEVEIARGLVDMDLPDEIRAAAGAFYTRLRREIEAHGKARNMPMFDLVQTAAEVPFKAVEYFFPNYFLLPMYSGMASYRVRPLTPETCLFELWSLAFFPAGEVGEPPVAPVPTAHDDPGFPEIPRQDYSNLPLQQLGLHSGGFRFMRLSPKVEGMISNYQRAIDGFLAGLPAETVGRAAGLAGTGLDSPIVDIGI